MKSLQIGWLCLLLSMTPAVWGYGSSSSSKACEKPGFSQFSPPDKATAAPNSEFSFIASPNTRPDTIKVVVKNIPVSIAINTVAQGYRVSGTLPEALRGTFVRITIDAEGASRCKGSGGWLVKVAE